MINCANGEDLEFWDELTKQLDVDLDLKLLEFSWLCFQHSLRNEAEISPLSHP